MLNFTTIQPNKNLAFSLIELLVVMCIILMLAAMIVPTYKNYVISSQVAVLLRAVEEAKVVVTSDYYKTSAFTNSNYAVNTTSFTTSNNNIIDATRGIAVVNGIVTIFGSTAKFPGKNIWIKWYPTTTNNDLVWNCCYSPDADAYINTNYCPNSGGAVSATPPTLIAPTSDATCP